MFDFLLVLSFYLINWLFLIRILFLTDYLNNSFLCFNEANLFPLMLIFSRQIEILSLGVSALLGFVQVNWTGPQFAEDTDSNLSWLSDEKCALDSLVIDGEGIYPTILYPQLLVLARSIIQVVTEMFSSKLHVSLCIFQKLS